jgi:hypothetical protein
MFVHFILLLVLQFLAGAGLLSKLDKSLPRFVFIPLAILVGSFVGTLAVYLLGVFSLPVTWLVFLGVFSVLVLGSLFPFQASFAHVLGLFKGKPLNIKIYEVLVAAFVLYVFFISAWRTYYLPVVSYDSVNGIDLFAKNAIAEGKIVCWIFDGAYIKSLSTQAYYAPFTAFEQIIYRLAGFPFGQVWLALVFLCFIVYLYHALKQYVHGALAGFILLITITVPEFYAYTFILQTDFVNAVFTLIGVVFLFEFWQKGTLPKLYMSILFFAMACWARSETVFFLPFFGLFVFFKFWKESKVDAFKLTALFGLLSATTFILWNIIFYRFYFPNAPQTGALMQWGDYSMDNLLFIISDINEKVVFADVYWGYLVYIVLFFMVLELLVYRKLSGAFFLISLVIFYVTFVLLEIHFVHFNIDNTFRRGFFKFTVVGYFYLSQTQLLSKFSKVLTDFESKK